MSLFKDRHVRNHLHQTVLAEAHNSVGVRVIDEFGCEAWGNTIVDVAVIEQDVHGYEIKSDADNLDRLPKQSEAYSRVFDRVTLVVASKHLDHVVIPGWWGLIEVRKDGSGIYFQPHRPAAPNPSLDLEARVSLLWRDEAYRLLREYDVKKISKHNRHQLQRLVLKEVPPGEIPDATAKIFRERVYPNAKRQRETL